MIIQDNKAIAIFMGGKTCEKSRIPMAPQNIWLPIHGICRWDTIELGRGKTLEYHNNWQWLMPVINKIGMLAVERTISMGQPQPDNEGKYHCWIIERGSVKNKVIEANTWIEATYGAVVEFIQWYNIKKVEK